MKKVPGPKDFAEVTEIPAAALQACLQLVAQLINQNSDVLNYTLKGLTRTDTGEPLPDVEISIRRL